MQVRLVTEYLPTQPPITHTIFNLNSDRLLFTLAFSGGIVEQNYIDAKWVNIGMLHPVYLNVVLKNVKQIFCY